ncbi:Fc.00g032560.m01.CDS01 [Cosmosporella sp. VM-42]
MTEFITGTALGAVGVLFAIKGAVDGYVFIAEIFASDKGLNFAALQYYIEGIKFKSWGERLKTDDEANCLLKKESKLVQDAVARIVAEILATQEIVGEKFIKKYRLEAVKAPIPGKPGGPGARPAFHEKSAWISHFRRERDKQKQPHAVAWASKDKEKFTELLSRLATLNQDLEDLVRPDEFDETRLVTSILSGLDQRLSLAPLQAMAVSSHPSLLSLAALLKQIQEEDVVTAAARVKHLAVGDLDLFSAPTPRDGRSDGSYEPAGQLPQPVIIEWKYIDATHAGKSDIVTRIQALGALLSAANPAELHRLPCLGTFDDAAYEQASKGGRRIGLVYSVPRGVNLEAQTSPSLLQLIQQRGVRPPLGQRFDLAHRLAGAVALLHAANWIHKSLRSDNILFGGKGTNDIDITEPYICGFQYSRPATGSSLEQRPVGVPELDLYYHPEVHNGWNKVLEVYSLGIVLLEVAVWRPVFEKKYQNMKMREVSEDILAALDGKFGKDVVGLVGTVFVDVIKCCLKGEFGVVTGNTPQEAKMLSKRFFQKVVEPLASCKA